MRLKPFEKALRHKENKSWYLQFEKLQGLAETGSHLRTGAKTQL